MGLTKSIYFDSCLAIYLVEENPTFLASLEDSLAIEGDARLCISPLTEMECLVLPLRLQSKALITKFENWFDQVTVLPIDSDIYRRAAQMRADLSSLKTPDALHLATAQYHGCDEFWTNDDRLGSVAPSLVKNILSP